MKFGRTLATLALAAAKVGIWTVIIVVAVLVFLYFLSIPRPWYEVKAGMEVEVIQAGIIQSVWIPEEEGGSRRYVNVLFGDGAIRQVTISTVNLRVSPSVPNATIYRITYPGSHDWSFISMDVKLPREEYWEFRWAGWPLLGERFRKAIRINF